MRNHIHHLSILYVCLITLTLTFTPPAAHASTANYEQQFPHVFTRHGPPLQKIALTFDDGPDLVYTPKILAILKKEHVHATFFVLGVNAARHPEMIRRIVQEGHALGNHSFNHANLVRSTRAKIKWEIFATEQVLVRISGQSPKWVRPPYGNVNSLVLTQLKQLGYHVVNWSVDSNDWKSLSARQIKQNILSAVRPGAIILQHCSGSKQENLSGTVRALPDVIHVLQKKGYRFVTIPQLLTPESQIVHAKPRLK